MNFGIIVLGLFLVAAASVIIFMIAGSSQSPVIDTFGNTSTPESNATSGTITNVTSPIASAGAGMALILSAIFLVSVGALLVASARHTNGGRR
jgi:hypothetical protein